MECMYVLDYGEIKNYKIIYKKCINIIFLI
jgi:hypothetical protein